MGAVALGRNFEFKVGRAEVCPTGVAEVDAIGRRPSTGVFDGDLRAGIVGAHQPDAGGHGASHRPRECCALVDASDAFDPASAAAAGVRLERLLWVRCGGNAEHALKAADLLVQGGGFGLVVMDLADTPPITARRISMTSWFRLRRAVEHTPTVLLVVEQQPHAKTCASLTLEMRRERAGRGPARRAARDCCAASGCMWTGASPCRRSRHLSNRAGRAAMFAAIHARPGDVRKVCCGWRRNFRRRWSRPPRTPWRSMPTGWSASTACRRKSRRPWRAAPPERGLQASVAIAANLDAAVHAARGFAGVSVIPYGDEAKFLGSLPLTLLGPTPEMQETLERWGIRRFRDLAALPELGLAERLGPEGLRLHKLARGAGDRPLVPVREPLHFEEETELEYPVELLEPLVFVLARLLHGLRARLVSRGLATNELRLRLKLENRGEHTRTLRFPVPMLDTKAFLKLLDLDLGAHPPPAPVVKVWLEAEPAKPRAAQTGLFIPLAPEPEKLELTLARLKSLVGEKTWARPRLLDTHRPGAFQMLARPLAASPQSPLSPRRWSTARHPSAPSRPRADGLRAAGACTGGRSARACESRPRGPGALPEIGGPPIRGRAMNGMSR